MHQPYAYVRAMDLGHWPADGKALVKKVGQDPRQAQVQNTHQPHPPRRDKYYRVWSDQPLFDRNVSVLVKPRGIKCCDLGSRDATVVNSALGANSTARPPAARTRLLSAIWNRQSVTRATVSTSNSWLPAPSRQSAFCTDYNVLKVIPMTIPKTEDKVAVELQEGSGCRADSGREADVGKASHVRLVDPLRVHDPPQPHLPRLGECGAEKGQFFGN
jgi:hypothetical protein